MSRFSKNAPILLTRFLMFFDHTTFIGIDPTAGQRPITYAALDIDLRLLALGEGDIEEVTAFAGGQKSAYVAVSAPRRPNQGLMKSPEVRETLSPVPRPGRWSGFRVVEYQLFQHNIRIPRTPSKVKDCPNWMRLGFDLYQRLVRLGYKSYPASESPCQVLEVYPHAAFTVLLERLPFPKRSLEGRLQRQLILHSKALEIPDPMRIFEEITRYRMLQGVLPLDGLYNHEELEALVGAFTAWMAVNRPEEVSILGDPEEGQIVLPMAKIQEKY
ncbi:MAG: DUF429 domain-containing protein [Anaerolineales bacterium]